jgi:hypothetical protein
MLAEEPLLQGHRGRSGGAVAIRTNRGGRRQGRRRVLVASPRAGGWRGARRRCECRASARAAWAVARAHVSHLLSLNPQTIYTFTIRMKYNVYRGSTSTSKPSNRTSKSAILHFLGFLMVGQPFHILKSGSPCFRSSSASKNRITTDSKRDY